MAITRSQSVANTRHLKQLGFAAIALCVLQIVFFGSLFFELEYGNGKLVFTVLFSVGSMLIPFVVLYSLFYFCRGKATKREDVAVYVPITVLLVSSWFFVIGILKLFLDRLGKDTFFDVIPAFSSRDHFLTWSLLSLYILCCLLSLREFHKQIKLIIAQHKPSQDEPAVAIGEIHALRTNNLTIGLLFVLQGLLTVLYFYVGLDVLGDENECAFCLGCVEHLSTNPTTTACNPDISQIECEQHGHKFCATRDGPSFTSMYLFSFALACMALGLVLFLAIMHRFADSHSLKGVQNHTWSLVPIGVAVVDTWVCGSGEARIFMRVLGVQAMRDVFPTFDASYRALFYVLGVVYLLHVPICLFLTKQHLVNLGKVVRRTGSIVGNQGGVAQNQNVAYNRVP